MKIALVHDYIKEYGGAERVLEALHETWPDAPVFTSVYLPQFLGPHKERFRNWDIRESWVRFIPFREKLISPLRLLAPFIFRQFDFSGFDVVIVSATGAYIPNGIKIKNQKSKIKNTTQNSKFNDERNHTPYAISHKPIHICYCHTPPRYLYGYKTARDVTENFFTKPLFNLLRSWDKKSSENVDFYIANSLEVKARIKKFYGKDAIVIYPPVEVNPKSEIRNSKLSCGARSGFARQFKSKNEEYYLCGGRLARSKGIDIIIKAFLKLNKPLKIFGKGFAGYDKEMQNAKCKMQNADVDFLGEVSDGEKYYLMKRAKAFVFASFDEDFGITPVEAMSVGTPVIAYNSGGVKETVLHEKTGVLYDDNSPEGLIEAITHFEKIKIDAKDCMAQAERFSKERFQQEMKNFIQKILQH